MKSKQIGIVVMVIGIVMMVYTGFNYVTTERVAKIGPIEINQEKEHQVQWTPILGILLTVGGVLIMVSTKKD